MADEAVLRIILQDSGRDGATSGGFTAPPSGSYTSSATPSPFPPSSRINRISGGSSRITSGAASHYPWWMVGQPNLPQPLGPPPPPPQLPPWMVGAPQPFGPPPPPTPSPYPSWMVGQPNAPQPFGPSKPPPPVSLEEEARRKHDLKERAAKVDAKYKEMYGEKETGFSKFLDVAEGLRGTIGGRFGQLSGSALDATAALRGMGGASGAMAAGPAAAVAMAIAAIVKEINREVIGAIKGGVGEVSSIANFAASANADPAEPIIRLGDAASKAGEKLADQVPLLGYMAVATGEVTKALGSFMQAVDKTVERYGEYSPVIAQSQASAEITQTLGDLRRAQEVGPELARYVQVRTDLQQKFEDIKINLLTKILTIVTPLLELLGGALATGQNIGDAIGALIGPLAEIAAPLNLVAQLSSNRDARDVVDPTNIILNFPTGQQLWELEGQQAAPR